MNTLTFAYAGVYFLLIVVTILTAGILYKFVKDKKTGKVHEGESRSNAFIYIVLYPMIIIFEIFHVSSSVFLLIKEGNFRIELLPAVYLISAIIISYILYKRTEKYSLNKKISLLIISLVLLMGSYLYFKTMWLPATAKIYCEQERISEIVKGKFNENNYNKCINRYLQ